jgi:adducin
MSGSVRSNSVIIPVNDLDGVTSVYSDEEKQARCKLAATYRLVDNFGWSQQIANHISLKAPGVEDYFLLNPFGLLYSEVTASNLVKLDLNGGVIDRGTTGLGAPYTGFIIHSAIHSARPDIKCIIHVHTTAGAAVSAMKCGLLTLSQEAIFAGDVSYHDYQGVSVDEKEKEDIIASLGPVNNIMILRNHGLLAMGETVEIAYYRLHSLMDACEIQVKAMGGGLDNLIVIDREIIQQTNAVDTSTFGSINQKEHVIKFEALMRDLDRKGYRTGYQYKLSQYIPLH